MTELSEERPAEAESTPEAPSTPVVEQPVVDTGQTEPVPVEPSQEPPAGDEPSVTDAPIVDGASSTAPWPPMPPQPPVATRKRPGKLRSVPRRAWITVGALFVAGGVIGALIGVAAQPDPTTSKAYVALQSAAASQSSQIVDQNGTIQNLRSQVDSNSSQAAALSAAQASVAAQASAVASEQAAVQSAQAVVVQNQIPAGEYVVGKDVKAGTYRSNGPDGSNGAGCFYEWRAGTDANASIIDNNISQGAATATLTDGQVFRTDGCQPWNKVG
ncbi:hypothetical protein [Sinomonas susongensis]|uniref:hypothetical protein n=1 Tax=Sinomonas susongensis TaxID=1324851 RepID=UPI001109C13D|nr:hypothetical protein [Sinomonas susongensis]